LIQKNTSKQKHIILRLLSNDIIELHKAVNNFNLLKAYLQMRTDYELHELIEKANELIRLLKETYID
jgi:hypothetical protein